jgi:hypothetical protein
MLRLSPDELDRALLAIQVHGYGDFFPDPPELSLLVAKWDEIRNELALVDLDLYEGYDVIFAFAPKSRLRFTASPTAFRFARISGASALT